MPIFDYVCKKCGNEFEFILLAGETAECPECHSTKLEKKMVTNVNQCRANDYVVPGNINQHREARVMRESARNGK